MSYPLLNFGIDAPNKMTPQVEEKYTFPFLVSKIWGNKKGYYLLLLHPHPRRRRHHSLK